MTKHFADTFHICSIADTVCCKCMAKCMKMRFFYECFIQIGMKLILISAGVHGRYFIQNINTVVSARKKDWTEKFRNGDFADRTESFGRSLMENGFLVSLFCSKSLNSSADMERFFPEINILPLQCTYLCFCQYKSKKNLLLIRKKHHCFHPVMLLRTILFRLCFFFFVENVIHLPAYLHTTWFINKDFLNNL